MSQVNPSTATAVQAQAEAGLARRSGNMERNTMSDLLKMMGAGGEANAESDSLPLVTRQLRAGTALFHEGSPADAVYFVASGSFKNYRTAEDGYEQVLGFFCGAEVLGFDAICTKRHPTAAVALENSQVFVVRVADLFEMGNRVPAFGRELHLAVSRQLTRRAEIAELMAAVAAEVRLARFLIHLSERMQAAGRSPDKLHLHMCRRDIASHLGVAHETVSRSFSALVDDGFLNVKNREIDILDLDGLREFSHSTRGNGEAHKSASADRAVTARASKPRPKSAMAAPIKPRRFVSCQPVRVSGGAAPIIAPSHNGLPAWSAPLGHQIG